MRQILIRPGEPPLPVAETLAGNLLQLIEAR
jgi:hypothetical protein